MAGDALGTWNHIVVPGCWSPAVQIPVNAPADLSLGSITLPDIAGATIMLAYVRLKVWRGQFVNGNWLSGVQGIQIKKTGGVYTNAIPFSTGDLGNSYSDCALPIDILGSIDVSSTVDAFDTVYELLWNDAYTNLGNLNLFGFGIELEIWFTLDSGVETKIDDIGDSVADMVVVLADIEGAGFDSTTDGLAVISPVVTDIDDKIWEIEEAITPVGGLVVADGETQTTFKTDLLNATDDYYNNQLVVFASGVNEGLSRRISDYDGTDKIITVDDAFPFTPAGGERFWIVPRYISAGSALTPSAIATAVHSEPVPGSFTPGQAGRVLGDLPQAILDVKGDGFDSTTDGLKILSDKADTIDGKADSILEDTGTDLPDTLADIEGTGFDSATDSLKIISDNLEIMEGSGFDSTTDSLKILSDKSDIIDGKADAILEDTGTDLPKTLADIEGDGFDSTTDSLKILSDKSDITDGKVDSILEDTGTDIPKTLADIEGAGFASTTDSLKVISDAIDGVSGQVSLIQNNVSFTTTILEMYDRPETGTKTINIKAQIFDTDNNPEDPDGAILSITLTGATSGVLIPATPMTKIAVGVYSIDYVIDHEDELENWEFYFEYVEGGITQPRYVNSKLTEYASDLNDIQTKVTAIHVKTDAGTASPTIPAQITTHDTDMKALPRVEACPDQMYVPSGRTLINIEGGISDTDDEIPVLIADNLPDSGIVKIESEYIIYDEIIDSVLQVTSRGAYSTTPATHANNKEVLEVVLYPVRLAVFKNDGSMVDADSPPTIEIKDWNGTQELAPTAMTKLSTGIYSYNYLIVQGTIAENKIFIFTAIVNSKTAVRHHEVIIIDRPASESALIDLLGGGTGDYPCTEEGWYDHDGILHEWNDDLEGTVKDVDTGAPLDDAYVTAFLITTEPLYNGRPPGQARTRVNGTWFMWLDAADYQFVIEKDGFRIAKNGTVTRTVG